MTRRTGPIAMPPSAFAHSVSRAWRVCLLASACALAACASQPAAPVSPASDPGTPTSRADAGADPAAQMRSLIDAQLDFAAQQYKVLAANTPADRMPRSFEDGKPVTSDTEWWTSGFYPGTLWMIYGATRDPQILAEAQKRLKLQEKEKFYVGNHDIGFMIFGSFGKAWQLTGDPHQHDVMMTAAQTATKRYKPAIKAIQSWDSSDPGKAPVIIDNLMNLELLLWASEQKGGDPRYRQIAIQHAETTLAHHFRPDCSSYHVVDYDPESGKVVAKKTAQGAADSSAWSRGQAWALYGYTMLYRETRDPRYLQQARCVAGFILDNPNLPADKVPYWDFNAPGIPDALRDASAAAVMASALLELGQYVQGDERARYVADAGTMLRSLSAPPYRAEAGANGGFLLQHSVGALPYKSEIDVPLTYADYYFIEALLRYRQWYLPQ